MRTRVRLRVTDGGDGSDITQPVKWQRVADQVEASSVIAGPDAPPGQGRHRRVVYVPQPACPARRMGDSQGQPNGNKRFLTIGGIRTQNPFSQNKVRVRIPSSAAFESGFHEGKSIRNCNGPVTNGAARKRTDSPSTCLPFVNSRSRERCICPICEPYLAYLERLSFSELPSGLSSGRKASFDRPQ